MVRAEVIRSDSQNTAVKFYQERYAHGYMDEWLVEKKRRIFEIIRSLELPDAGEALDFGCGNGVLTDVIRQALPAGWKVYGTDISSIAVENARSRYPQCTFFAANDSEFASHGFDFVFTHHVLEHVHDLSKTLHEINDYLKGQSAMLHILPCGNEGSFEHSVCLLRRDGIDSRRGNRFFFEDEGHVRRLTTEQLSVLVREMGFILAREYYSNQYYGAMNWITRSGPGFMRSFIDTSSAVDEDARRKLVKLRHRLFLIWALRYPAAFVEDRLSRRHRPMRDYFFLAFGLPLYGFTKPMDWYIKARALDEWRRRKTERNGSEMYLHYERRAFTQR